MSDQPSASSDRWMLYLSGSADLDDFATAQIESNYDEVTDSFDNMNLKGELLRGLQYLGASVGI